MDPEEIINEIADTADTVLDGIVTRKDARRGLAEHIQTVHPDLPPDDRLIVVRGVMSILDREEFFTADTSRTESIWDNSPGDAG